MISAVLLISSLLSLYSCAQKFYAADLMEGVTPNDIEITEFEGIVQPQMKFSLDLISELANNNGGENIMISPLSITLALAMTANGADGETLSQMETLLGGEYGIDQINEMLYSYVKSLPSNEKSRISVADSIWFRDDAGLMVKKDFLQKNADYYGAGAFKSPFDSSTIKDINAWVKENTKGMIDEVIKQIDPLTMLYLINAVAFEAEWQSKYDKFSISDAAFTSASGEKQTVSMMYGEEGQYISLDGATGFKKNYYGGDYSFVALLPKEGMTPEELIAGLDPIELNEAVISPTVATVRTGLPSFEAEYGEDISASLAALGMPDAFGAKADFTNMAECDYGDLYIDSVIHKTYIKVDASGTKAGAVTAVDMKCESAPMEEPKVVILDRPFVYMITHNETGLPLFIGILNTVN